MASSFRSLALVDQRDRVPDNPAPLELTSSPLRKASSSSALTTSKRSLAPELDHEPQVVQHGCEDEKLLVVAELLCMTDYAPTSKSIAALHSVVSGIGMLATDFKRAKTMARFPS